MHPSFEQFVAALRDPSLRAGIGLVVDDADAAALLTRQDWASDYYHKWLALFPVAAAAAAAPPAAAPPATAPPAPSPAVVLTPPPAPTTWQTAPAASRVPSRAKVPLVIAASVLGVLLLTAGAVGVYTGLISTTPVAQHSSVSSGSSSGTSSGTSTGSSAGSTAGTGPSAPATTAAQNPAVGSDTHGLTPEEYQLMDAAAAPSGHSIEEEIAHGLSDAQLRSEADLFETQIKSTCTAAAAYPQGIENATFKASFIAGYAVQVHITTEQATAVYTALVNYCLSI
jgi:hypothetical protein